MADPAALETKKAGDIKQVPLAENLGGFPAATEPYAVFRGYLYGPVGAAKGTNAPKGVYLLYTDDTFSCWLTIKFEDLVAHIAAPTNPFDGRGKVWVVHNARITRSDSGEAGSLADDIVGGGDPGGGPTRPPGWPY